MPDASEERSRSEESRIPRPAIVVVIVGVLASLAIYGLSFVPGSGSVEIELDTVEPIAAKPSQDVGEGRFLVTRTSLSALAPNEDGLLLYRVAGIVRVDSGGRNPTNVRCDVISGVDGDTRLARSKRLRAAWPRSSDKLQAQAAPETSYVKYTIGDAKKIDLPIRDVLNDYTNSLATTTVKWDGYIEDRHAWTWLMPDGTGAGTATLPWAVIFEAEDRPKGTVECSATIGGEKADVRLPFLQEEWPIVDDQPNEAGTDTGDASNVE